MTFLIYIFKISYLLLNNVRVPRAALLDKQGGVSPDGVYITPFKDISKRFGAVLGTLSGGRVSITGLAICNLINAMTIAVRYSACRKQFGPSEDSDELPVIEYQMQVKICAFICCFVFYKILGH